MIPLASAAGGAAASVFQDLLDGARKRMRRVVITGLGVVAPNGIGKDSFWSACTNGRSGVGPIKSFDASAHPVKVAAEVTGFDAYPYIPNGQRKNLKVMSRAMQFAVGAAGMAVEDSGLELSKEDPERLGVVMGTGIVPMDLTELAPALAEAYDGDGRLQTTKLARRGESVFFPLWILKQLPN